MLSRRLVDPEQLSRSGGHILPLGGEIGINDAWESILKSVVWLQLLQSGWAAYMLAKSAQRWGDGALSTDSPAVIMVRYGC